MFEFLIAALMPDISEVPCGLFREDEAVIEEKAASWSDRGWYLPAKEVCEQLSQQYETIYITAVSSRSIRLTSGEPREGFQVGELKAGRILVEWHDISADEMQTLKKSLLLSVKGFKKVWVAKKSLATKAQIDSGDLTLELKDVAKLAGVAEVVTRSPVGLIIRKHVAAHTVLTKDMLADVPLISRNSEVSVEISKGQVKIITKGMVLGDVFKISDRVFVRLNDAEKIVKGRLVSENLVTVEL